MSSERDGAGRRRVLIVDRSADTREVLRTALERRGLQIFEAPGPQQGLEVARRCQPDLIVLDLEATSPAEASVLDGYSAQLRHHRSELLLLGGAGRPPALARGQHVTAPYHYAPLVRKIEQLLDGALTADAA